jgi:hypothetical protein
VHGEQARGEGERGRPGRRVGWGLLGLGAGAGRGDGDEDGVLSGGGT